jgi:uncharacterized membrane protein SpoIIM required for sporulation
LDYARFLRLRAAAWDRFETDLERARSRPGELDHDALEGLAVRYRQVLLDHATAASRFAGTRAATRLSRLALAGTHALVHAPAPPRRGVIHFFRNAFPRAFRRQLPQLLVAVSIFVACAAFGLRLGAVQPGVGATLLGPATLEGLEEGRLWTESLVSAIPPEISSSAIARNNMSVAITGWAGGALLGLGALYVLVLNGLMLGTIFGVTGRYAMDLEQLEFVAAHGPLEIFLILVTAAAGLRRGLALAIPGERRRAETVSDAGLDALVVLGGCLPWFLVLGVVEGYVSPSPGLAAVQKGALGAALLGSFLLLAWGRPEPE